MLKTNLPAPLTKRNIARVLKEIGFFLRFKGENPFRARAYERAADALLVCPDDPQTLVETGRLTQVHGIGPGTASVITELVSQGFSCLHQTVQGTYPASLVELGEVPGLRLKQLRRLYHEAGIRSIAELQDACRNDRLLGMKGIGPKVQAKLLNALGEFQRGQGYHLYANVLGEALHLEQALRTIPGIGTVCLAGALRRKMEVVHEYVFVLEDIKSAGAAQVREGVQTIPNLTDTMGEGNTLSALSPMGVPVRMIVASREQFGLHVLQATGSDEHLQQLLGRFRKGCTNWQVVSRRFKGASEEALYRAAGLPYIPPELREGRDEIERLAGTKKTPRLVEAEDIRGFFHFHTDYSDGVDTIEDMVRAARDRGYQYVGISDHSQSAFYANGLKEPRIRQQWEEIERVQQRYPDIHIFKGIEADILPDGSMDYPDTLLSQFDFVIASVHSRFNLSEAEQTERLCRALSNPFVTMLGHPTGRLLLSRPGYRVNLAPVIETAAGHRKFLEINGSRYRLDLDWRMVQLAKARGVKFCVNPDAHAVDELINVGLGANVARKGGLEKKDIVNTSSLAEMQALFSKRRISISDTSMHTRSPS